MPPGMVDRGSPVKNTWAMTAVIDIPDDLYKKVTARVAWTSCA